MFPPRLVRWTPVEPAPHRGSLAAKPDPTRASSYRRCGAFRQPFYGFGEWHDPLAVALANRDGAVLDLAVADERNRRDGVFVGVGEVLPVTALLPDRLPQQL